MRVALDGNIGSGKSSVMAMLHATDNIPVFPEPVDDWAELLDLFYMSPREYAFALSMRVLLSFRACADSSRCLSERSPMSCRYVFGQLAYNEGLMSQGEWDLFKEYCDLLGWIPDAIVFIDTPAEVCMTRIRERARECETRLDLAYVKRVEFQYTTLEKYCNVPFIRVDGSQPAERVAEDVRRVLHTLGCDGWDF